MKLDTSRKHVKIYLTIILVMCTQISLKAQEETEVPIITTVQENISDNLDLSYYQILELSLDNADRIITLLQFVIVAILTVIGLVLIGTIFAFNTARDAQRISKDTQSSVEGFSRQIQEWSNLPDSRSLREWFETQTMIETYSKKFRSDDPNEKRLGKAYLEQFAEGRGLLTSLLVKAALEEKDETLEDE